MSRQVNRTLIGAFVLGAITLWVTTVFLLAGNSLFREQSQHVMYFHGEAQGLQVGAPVVFLGVNVGTVKRIQLGLDEKSNDFLVPVTVEVDSQTVLTRSGTQIDLQAPATIRQLVDRGLRAQLKTQSILTGQLYVDLDFYEDKPAQFMALDPGISEIPTIPTRVAELTTMLEDFSMEEFLANLTAISESINRITSAEELTELPVRLEKILANLESLTTKLDSSAEPILTGMQTDLAELHHSLVVVRTAVNQAGNVMDQIGELARGDSALGQTITRAGQQVDAAARGVADLTHEDSQTIQHLNTTLLEIARSARAMRLLAETLEQQPEAIIKGKVIKEHDNAD